MANWIRRPGFHRKAWRSARQQLRIAGLLLAIGVCGPSSPVSHRAVFIDLDRLGFVPGQSYLLVAGGGNSPEEAFGHAGIAYSDPTGEFIYSDIYIDDSSTLTDVLSSRARSSIAVRSLRETLIDYVANGRSLTVVEVNRSIDVGNIEAATAKALSSNFHLSSNNCTHFALRALGVESRLIGETNNVDDGMVGPWWLRVPYVVGFSWLTIPAGQSFITPSAAASVLSIDGSRHEIPGRRDTSVDVLIIALLAIAISRFGVAKTILGGCSILALIGAWFRFQSGVDGIAPFDLVFHPLWLIAITRHRGQLAATIVLMTLSLLETIAMVLTNEWRPRVEASAIVTCAALFQASMIMIHRGAGASARLA